MSWKDQVVTFLTRVRYPGALPEDLGRALGLQLPNSTPFSELLELLTSDCCMLGLRHAMPRQKVERLFAKATCREQFGQCTLCSFYFREGWLEIELHFDTHACLERAFIHHRLLSLLGKQELLLAC